jgi:hypothetical protein
MKLKVRTQHCGIVEVDPENVLEIWEGGLFHNNDFTHTLRVKDITGKFQHHVYGISTKAALKLSEISNKAIDKVKFGQEYGDDDVKIEETKNTFVRKETTDKSESTLMNYA